MASAIAAGLAARGLRSSTCAFHWPNSSAARPLAGAQFGNQRDHAGIDAGHQPVGFLATVVAHQQPAGAAGQIGHVRAPLVEDQVQVPAEGIPALWEGCDAGIAAGDFQGDGASGKCFLRLVDPCSTTPIPRAPATRGRRVQRPARPRRAPLCSSRVAVFIASRRRASGDLTH
jgi:hypothetical protein